MPWNGPPRELHGPHHDDTVYCVQCGSVYVWADGRSCPACTLNERLEEIEDR